MWVSRRSVWWMCAAVLVAGIGYGVYSFAAGRISDTYSNDVGGVLVSADGREVSATAPGQQMGDCQDNTSNDLAVSETPRTVEIRVHTRREQGGFAVCAPGSAAAPTALSVTLSSPLWGRTLVDGDGRPLAYFDGRTMLTPHPIPAGYSLFEVYPGTRFVESPNGSAPAVVQDYNAGSAVLFVSQQVGTRWRAPDNAPVKEIIVGAHPAQLYTDRASVGVEWAQGGQIVQVVASDSQVPAPAQIDAVVAIAQSLR